MAILTLSHGAPDDGRATASRRAAGLIGAELYLGDLEDTHIGEGADTIAAVARVVAQVQPTVV